MSAEQIAEEYGISIELIHSFLNGSRISDGKYDPFEVCNYLTWNALDAVPSLKRRWHIYAECFSFKDCRRDLSARHIQWRHERKIYLPESGKLQCRLAKPLDRYPFQERHTLHVDEQAHWRINQRDERELSFIDENHKPSATSLFYRSSVTVYGIAIENSICRKIFDVLEPFIAEFRYIYREHSEAGDLRSEGSCLDCAVACAALLQDAGMQIEIQGGVIAHNRLANPHFWLHIYHNGKIIPCDPSMAAIARMLGYDWQKVLWNYCGYVDARRVYLSEGSRIEFDFNFTYPVHAPGFCAITQDGQSKNAWHCLDWVCGSCSDSFRQLG